MPPSKGSKIRDQISWMNQNSLNKSSEDDGVGIESIFFKYL